MRSSRKGFKIPVCILLVFTLLFAMPIFAFAEGSQTGGLTKADVSTKLNTISKYIVNTVKNPVISSIGGEWSVLGLARSGVGVPQNYYDNYYQNVVAELKEKDGVLTKTKYTEYSRLVLALTAIGKDVTNVGGYNLLEKLSDFNNVKKQGINGPIFALIAFDSKNYSVPAAADAEVQTTREMLIDYILSKEITDANGIQGGFSLTGNVPDPDITGMALQALAKYKNEPKVKAAIDRALSVLNRIQNSDGGFETWGEKTSESIIQVIIGKAALGMDAKVNLSALMDYYLSEGSFRHTPDGNSDLMATEQGLYALAAYSRYLDGKNTLYDMTDVTAQSSEIKVKYNGTYLTFDQPPVNQDGSVLVPMKVIFEAIGAALTWDPAEKKVTAILGDKTIVLVIGNQTATVNGVPQTLSVPAKLINSRTMVPVRFVSESLDADVSWDQTTKTVIIKN